MLKSTGLQPDLRAKTRRHCLPQCLRPKADLPVEMSVESVEDAVKGGAYAFFNEPYDEKVKVYSIGDYSKEVCGGPHVEHTGKLGTFVITKEQSSSAGVRRIRAVLKHEN